MYKNKFLPALLCLVTIALKAQPLSFADKVKQYESFLLQFQREHHLPSFSVAILRDQKLVYSNASGYADIERKVPATDTTLYSIASLTKPIAATVIMKLQEEGKLDIDAPIKSYWPGYLSYFASQKKIFSRFARQYYPYIASYNCEQYDISIRHHLSHTSEGVPGTRFKYNGLLYGRLARIIDATFPDHFPRLVDSLVSRKLHLKHFCLNYEMYKSTTPADNLALPYVYESKNKSFKRMNFPDPTDLNAGAGLLCSVTDLARFDIAFDQDEIISGETKKQMLTQGKLNNGEPFPYGLGWFVTNYDVMPVIYHYGLQETYSGFYLKLPGKNITMIVLANSSGLTESYNTNIQNAELDSIPYVKLFIDLFGKEN